MLSNLRRWYLRNHAAITWFLIGWLSLGGIIDFSFGNYSGALLLWAIAFINYIMLDKP